MIPLESIDHVQITVAPGDVDATLAFYERVVGLARIPKSNTRPGGWFQLGKSQLHVGVEKIEREANLASKRHVCFVVTDPGAAELAFREAGVEILADPEPAPSWKRFYVRDPGGNRVEVAARQA
ncbi:MAG TPA: VOC family protein [Polyangiaceae bacterium]|jgi:catechol 2,3-dioxygenase-like lactoylglutathione lyase family enzyme